MGRAYRRNSLARRNPLLAARKLMRTAGIAPEIKYVGERVVDATFNNTISSADLYPVCPGVSQGVGDYQRLGTKIRGKYLYIRGTVSLADSMNTGSGGYADQANGPIVARLLCLQSKAAKTNGAISSVPIGSLLDDRIGTGATRAFAGNSYDVYAPLNKDLFTVYMDKKVKLIPQQASGVSTYPYVGQRTHAFSCRVPAPKGMSFDDTSSGNNPTNFAPFFCAAWAYVNDKVPGTADQVPVAIQAISTLYFTDA